MLVRDIQIDFTQYNNDGTTVFSDKLAEYIVEDGFPTSFSESMKGEGYFDFQVRSFTFQCLWEQFTYAMGEEGKTFSEEPKRLSSILISIVKSGGTTPILNGFVDEVQHKLSPDETIYEMTIFPNVLALKDISVGTETQDDEGESNYLYETKNEGSKKIVSKPLKDIVDEVLVDVNVRVEGASFQTSNATIPDAQPPSKNKLVGNLLNTDSRSGFFYSMYLWLFEGVTSENHQPNDSKNVIYRENQNADGSGDWYIQKSVRFAFKTLVDKGQWLDIAHNQWLDWDSGEWLQIDMGQWAHFSLSYPSGISFSWSSGISVSWSSISVNVPPGTISFPPDLNLPGTDISIPPVDIKIPTIAKSYKIHELKNGGMELHSFHEWYPLWPFEESAPNLGTYGSVHNQDTMSVTSYKRESIAESLGLLKEDDAILDEIVSFDHDEGNYYVMALVTSDDSEDFTQVKTRKVVFSLESPFDDNYKLQCKNWKMMELLQNLAKLSNRYVFVDVENNIHLVSRSQDLDNADEDLGLGTVYLEGDVIVKYSKKRHREDEKDIRIERLKYNDVGGIDEYGFHLRTPEYEGIKKYYDDYFSRGRIEYTLELIDTEDNLDSITLLKKLVIDGQSYGNVISIDRSFRENKIKLITEQYDSNE